MASMRAIFMEGTSADRALEQRHAGDPDIDLEQPPAHGGRAAGIEDAEIRDIERSAAEDAVERHGLEIEEIHRLAIPGDDVDAAGADGGHPEIAVHIDLEAVGDVLIGEVMDHALGA